MKSIGRRGIKQNNESNCVTIQQFNFKENAIDCRMRN